MADFVTGIALLIGIAVIIVVLTVLAMKAVSSGPSTAEMFLGR